MQTNNEYYKDIYEKISGETVTGVHSNNYYLKGICELYGYNYTGVKCNGGLIKDWAEAATGQTFTGTHFNNYYLKLIAEAYTQTITGTHPDNYYLGIILENIALTTIVRLSAPSTVAIGDTATIYATVIDEERLPVTGETVTFYVDGTSIGTGITDSNGVAHYDYVTSSVGSVSLTASYDTYNSKALTLTVIKHTSLVNIRVPATANVLDTITIEGEILIDGVGTSGLSMNIYQNGSLLDDVTSTTNGVFSITTSASAIGTLSVYAEYEESSTIYGGESTTEAITIVKRNSLLNLVAPETLVYTDEFNVTGKLTEADGVTGVNGATVSLLVGSTVVDTATTDANGDVEFTQTPLHMGRHTFSLLFNGNSNYNDSASSTVTASVNKEASVLTLSYPVDNAQYYSDGVQITGLLVDNDSTPRPIANKTIKVKENGTVIKTITTDSNGAFSDSITSLSAGSHTLSIGFEGDDYFEASTFTSKVITVAEPSISLTGDKNILSYADSENAVITATLNSATPTGQTMTMKAYKVSDDTLVDTLSVTDNGDGTYSGTYASGGVGDIYIKAECNLVSKTYSIIDTWKYIPLPSDYQTFSVPTGNYSIEWKGKFSSTSDFTSAINDGMTNYVGVASSHGDIGFYNPNNFLPTALSTDGVEKSFILEYNNGVWTFKHNNESVSDNRTLNRSALRIRRANNNAMYDFIIKPL